MRDIKFRGQRQSDNEWIYGDLLQPTELCDIYEISDCESIDGSRYDVIKYTIGQYTGLHDKNGKEIYDGDIVKALISGRWFVGKVIYEHSGFTIDVTNNKALEFGRRGIIEPWTEVIGNIYNNPELLGEQNEI